MTLLIRSLHATQDHTRVMALLHTAADYIPLERDAGPSPAVADEFFTDAPPGCDAAQSLRLGIFAQGKLIAITDMAVGYPDAQTAYLSLLLIAPHARGRHIGPYILRYLQSRAAEMRATAICLGVLAANPRGRAFWSREGFYDTGISGHVTLGAKTQLAYRLKKLL
jgi:ribosomal protein S18 acetylase RimI-like enzyme